MDHEQIVQATADYVKQMFLSDTSGHDWWHIYRVWQTAQHIAAAEQADLFVVQLAALLHDIADWKFHDGDLTAGPRAARAWLESLGVAEPVIAQVTEIIATLSFKGAGVPSPMHTLEGQVVQDADRLDAIGAVGIARVFAYGGHRHRPIHDPDDPPAFHASFEQYKNSTGTSINHFYEKLLLVQDRLNTPTARRMGAARHAFTAAFLDRFLQEWTGEA